MMIHEFKDQMGMKLSFQEVDYWTRLRDKWSLTNDELLEMIKYSKDKEIKRFEIGKVYSYTKYSDWNSTFDTKVKFLVISRDENSITVKNEKGETEKFQVKIDSFLKGEIREVVYFTAQEKLIA